MQIFNKLVRDKIPDNIIKNGEEPFFEVLSDKEYKTQLDLKLIEEVNEYMKDDNIEELADIYEVFIALLKSKNISMEELEQEVMEKRDKKGAYEKKIFLKYVK